MKLMIFLGSYRKPIVWVKSSKTILIRRIIRMNSLVSSMMQPFIVPQLIRLLKMMRRIRGTMRMTWKIASWMVMQVLNQFELV